MRKILFLSLLSTSLTVFAQSTSLQEILVSESLLGLLNQPNKIQNISIEMPDQYNVRMDVVYLNSGKSIKLHFPVASCEVFPSYVLSRDSKLYFFQDQSHRKITTDAGCSKFEITYILSPKELETAVAGRQHPGLEIPRVQGGAFPFFAGQDLNIDFKETEAYTISIEEDSTSHKREAVLFRADSNGYFRDVQRFVF